MRKLFSFVVFVLMMLWGVVWPDGTSGYPLPAIHVVSSNGPFVFYPIGLLGDAIIASLVAGAIAKLIDRHLMRNSNK